MDPKSRHDDVSGRLFCHMAIPPCWRHFKSDADAPTEACHCGSARNGELRRKIKDSGRPFLGRKGVLAQSPTGSPRTPEPRRELSPRYAARNKWRRIEKLQENKTFLREYGEALKKFAAGIRDVIFPAGTYWMRVHYGVACRAPP